MRTYLISYAQNASPVHAGFFAAMKTFAEVRDAEIIVIPGRYKNPTSLHTSKEQGHEWWDEVVEPYMAARQVKVEGPADDGPTYRWQAKRRKLCKNLTVYADMSIQPTANHPLTGFEVFLGGSSGIFGHPKRALETVPTGTRQPRFAFTTSSCTVANYTDSKAGKKGHAHHVIGALVVEVEPSGAWWARHVTASGPNGHFTDLDTVYTPKGAKKAPRALSLVLGDWHKYWQDDDIIASTKELVELVRPKHIALHDVLDFHSRSHHVRDSCDAFDRKDETVEVEVAEACGVPEEVCSWGDHETVVIDSNHHDHFGKWLDRHVPREDLLNDPYHAKVKARRYEHKEQTGEWPDLFEMEARRLGVPKRVRFLRRNEPLMVGGVALHFHGHKGTNGARGNAATYAKLGVKCSIAHSHIARIVDGVYQAGHSSKQDHKYNDLPSGWARAHVLQYADTKRAVVIFNGTKFRGVE